MPQARKNQISLDATPYYHCISRCVRRAFLCGTDNFSGNSYEHRRGWIEERLQELVDVFAIDIASFTIMHNHTHLVLYVDKKQADSWSVDEVLLRWSKLFSGNPILQKQIQNQPMIQAEVDQLVKLAKIWRERLCDISWFMRCLNEPIARRANEEDGCTGRFWDWFLLLQNQHTLRPCK